MPEASQAHLDRRRMRFAVMMIAACCAMGGCQRRPRLDRMETHPVAGSLFVAGKPAASAVVSLQALDDPQLRSLAPHAVVGADGAFQLTTFASGDGAPAGKYALSITWPSAPLPGYDTEGPDRFRGYYSNPQKPFKQVEIEARSNDLGRIELP